MSTDDCEVKSGDNQLASIEDTFVLKVKGTNGQVRWLGLQKVTFLLV